MRVLAYLLTVVLSTALTLGAALLAVFELHGASHGLLTATSFTIPFLVMGPVVLGSLSAYWDHRSSPEGRRILRWWFLGVVAIDVAAAIVVVLAAESAGAPFWVPAVLILGAAVLLAVARPLGTRFRRTERPITDDPVGRLVDRAAVRRKVVAIGVTFVIAVVVATIGAALLELGTHDHGREVTLTVLLAGQLTFTATAVAAVIVALPLNRALRDTGGRDLGRLRRFGKVVFRGKDLPLDDAEQRGAARYAALAPVAQGFQLAYLGLLYTGLAFQFVSIAIRGDLGVLPEVILAAMVVVLAIVVPLTLRRIGRARAYAEAHADLVEAHSVPAVR